MAFTDEAPDLRLLHGFGKDVFRSDVFDHTLTWFYLLDPDENRLEFTSDYYAHISDAFGGREAEDRSRP